MELKYKRANVENNITEEFEEIGMFIARTGGYETAMLIAYMLQQIVEEIRELKGEETVELGKDITELTGDDAKDFISSLGSEEALALVEALELDGDERKFVLTAIEERRDELGGE